MALQELSQWLTLQQLRQFKIFFLLFRDESTNYAYLATWGSQLPQSGKNSRQYEIQKPVGSP